MTARASGWKKCGAVLTLLAVCGTAWAVSPNIVISQVYGGGGNTGAQYHNDFIELFNRGTTTVSITGWSVQYASAAGTSWAVTALSGSIPAGGYYLVQEAAGAGGGAALPTPDAIGTIAMSSTSGKVALVSNSTALTGSCPLASTVDFVGFGTANCYEGTAAAPVLTNTTADFRASNGCTDTDQNGAPSADFATGAPAPRNSASPTNNCGVATGACCYPTNLCAVISALECIALSGTYLGDGTSCSGNPCGYPTGACCIANGFCSVMTQQDCATAAGTYQGNGASCVPNPCIGDSTIAAAKAAGTGKAVRLTNVIITSTTDLINSATSKCFQLQDDTGGITVYGLNADIDGALAGRAEGDRIKIEGTTGTSTGLFELMSPFPYVEYIDSPGVPAPIVVTSTDLADSSPTAEGYESELVTVQCVTFSAPGNFAYTTYTATDPTGSLAVRVSTTALDLVGQPIPTGPVHVTGIFSQYDTTDPRDGGYQLLPRMMADLVDAPECIPTGACCAADVCTTLTEAECTGGGGAYRGDGTICTPNPCVGACCVELACTVGLPADCTDIYLGDATVCAPGVCPAPVQGGDIALGLSQADPTKTAELIRAGAKYASWSSQAYVQSMEFDNSGGPHNAQGNLLALDFGTLAGGGRLVNLATDGSNGSQVLYLWDGSDPNIPKTRINGLSVSPGNQYVAATGPDGMPPYLYVLEYNAGPTVGTGLGASIGTAWKFDALATTGSLGTAWRDSDTVMLYCLSFVSGDTVLSTIDFDGAGGFTQTQQLSITVGTMSPTSVFTDVEYNPAVSPYVFCMYSDLTASVSTTKLTVVDPTTVPWTQVNQITLSGSLQTGREIALGPDGNLYLGQYAGSSAPTPRVYIDRLDASLAASWTDNSSLDYYMANPAPGISANFSGLDVAFPPPPPPTGACCVHSACIPDRTPAQCAALGGSYQGDDSTCSSNPCPVCYGDADCSGSVNFDDINYFVAALASGETGWKAYYASKNGGIDPPCTFWNCDANGSGLLLVPPRPEVNFDDINPFVAELVTPPACP